MRPHGRDLRAGVTGADVAALHAELVRLGYAIPDAELAQQLFGVATARAVAAFRGAHGLAATEIVDHDTAALIDAALTRPPNPVTPPMTAERADEPPRRLTGRLLTDLGLPAPGIPLRFYVPGFGGKITLLAETTTDRHGGYQLDRELPERVQRLDVRAIINDREVQLVAPVQKVDPAAPVDVVIPQKALPPPQSEFQRLSAGLRRQIGDSALAEAKEDDERRDLAFLRETTGWDARLVAVAATADKLARTVDIDPQVGYGLLRVGLPADPVQLARISPTGIENALRKAVTTGIVALDDAQIEAARERLDRFGTVTRRKLAINGTASSYGAMLKATGLPADQQDRFDKLFSAHTGDAATLWRRARADGLPADQLKLTAQLAAFTLNSARVTETLRAEAGSTDALPGTLVANRLYQPAAWRDRLVELAGRNDRVLDQMIPPAYVAETVTERLDAYAADLAFKVRRSYPTEVFGERIRSGELPLAGATPVLTRDVATVLDRAAREGYVPGQRSLHRFLRERREELFGTMPAERVDAAVGTLATLNRQYQITASDEAIAVLQQHDLGSAFQISAMPQRAFLTRYGAEFPSPAEAALTWRRAQQVTAVTLNVVSTAKQLDSARMLPAMAQPQDVVDRAREDLVKQFPTLESLFGSLDYCECEHCRSVLSPAAYLVDLLKFLDDAPASPRNPYDVVSERRPDLPHLPLTCENTNTVLPAIDVVNEILEFYLVHAQLTADAAYDTADAVSADLLAEPRNLLPAAYDILRLARYPLTAPFDLWLTTMRAFTAHFEVPFADLLEALRPSDQLRPAAGYGVAAVAYEQLGFSAPELALLTGADPLDTWPERYGYPPQAGPPVWGELAGAPVLARRLGVTYRELLDILLTRFVNPELADPAGDPLVLADPEGADSCGWTETTLVHRAGGAARPIDFLLLNTFVRIWRRLGWTIADTDQALVTFLPTDPAPRTGAAIAAATGSALLGVARLQRLAALLGASTTARRDLLGLWAPMSDQRYAELFLTGTAQTRDPVFDGEPGGYLTGGALLADHREAVQAALGLTDDEVTSILAAAGADPATAPLTVATVSMLDRHALLARHLRITVADLLVVAELSGLDPFTPLPAAPVTDAADDHPYRQTIRFVETVWLIAGSGLPVADLDFLLRHRFDPVGPHRTAAEPPLMLARALTAELNRIRAEYAEPADPLTFTDEAVAGALASVLDATVVAAFMDAWTGIAPLDPEIFTEHLRRQMIPGVGEVGFLDGADRAVLFGIDPADQVADAARRDRLAAALLPYVRQQLSAQAVVDAVATDLGGAAPEPTLLAALLGNPRLLDDPDDAGRPLLDGYLATAINGLTASDGMLTGFVEAPASGVHQFAAVCAAAGTEVRLSFDHLAEPLIAATSTQDDEALTAQIELRAGIPYGFTLSHPAGATVELRTRDQRSARTPVADLVTYPRTAIDRLHRLHLVLTKALRVVNTLGLTEIEVRHLLTHRDDFAGVDLGALPPAETAEPAEAVRARFRQLLRLVAYARLRDDIAADPVDLVALLVAARRTATGDAAEEDELLTDVTTRLAAITRRDPATVRAAAQVLGVSAGTVGDQVVAPAFTDERGLGRLWRVLSLANRIGVDPAALGRWATPTPDHNDAQDVRDTVKAKYPVEQWRQVAQSIFDPLRQRRRDALVAQVLQITGYERVEQLFEHFLIDPGIEPVVQTSRLRAALSSVQLFVQRCLLNLEEGVSPASINADHWEWMKRYRVWEANRKIFLWPENWLEPEFRDDKTHLCVALESALLEGDLDQATVEAAFIGYLRGLDEIARLDIRAIYLQRQPDPDANVLHVIGRTNGAPGRYYYRTWSHRSWSPWQPVTATIDGDHLAMVMWQGRIHLFWVLFLPQAEAEQQSSGTKAADLTIDTVSALKPIKKVEAQLYWSCYTPASNGAGVWSDPVLAGAEEPYLRTVNADFTAADVFIWADVLSDGAVSVSLLGEGAEQSFRVVSRHAPAEHTGVYRTPQEPPYLTADDHPLTRAGQGRWRGQGPAFRVHVSGYTITDQGVAPCDITEDVLSAVPGRYELVIVPPPAELAKSIGPGKGKGAQQTAARPEDPFFFIDAGHTFFVEPAWTAFSIGDGDQAVVAQNPVWHEFDKPEFWAAQPVAPAFPEPPDGPVVPGALLGATPIVHPRDVLTSDEAVVVFEGRLIGVDGLLADPGRLFRSGPHGAVARLDPRS